MEIGEKNYKVYGGALNGYYGKYDGVVGAISRIS